jgi:hypothetical protein
MKEGKLIGNVVKKLNSKILVNLGAIIIIFISMLLWSCKAQSANYVYGGADKVVESPMRSSYLEDSNYSVVKSSLTTQSGNIELRIEFPQLVGMEDRLDLRNRINDLIFNRAVTYFVENNINDELNVVNGYEIMFQNKNYLSIKFTGELSVSTYNPSNICFCLNIDMQTGKLLKFAEIIKIEEFRDFVNKKDFKLKSTFKDETGNSNILSQNEMITQYLESPFNNGDYEHIYDFYITDNMVGVIISTIGKYYNIYEFPLVQGAK